MKTVNQSEVTYIDHCGSDLSVVNAARVSFHKESDWAMPSVSMLDTKDIRLIQYLAKHNHLSPFNHSFLSFRIKAPIFVARQLVKHKFMPWNEVSRRYVDEEPEFYFPMGWRAKSINKKQGSEGVAELSNEGVDYYPPRTLCEHTLNTYVNMLKDGVCPEQARMVLPQNMMTEWIWSGTLGAFAAMLKLRLDPHTQQETREVAEKIYDVIQPLFPVSLKALLDVT